MIKKVLIGAAGVVVGFLNGLFGSGGGMAAVPLLKAAGVEDRQSHATSILIIASLSLFTLGVYLYEGAFRIDSALPYLPGGLAGGIAGALLLKRLPIKWIRLLFSLLILYSAFRLWKT
ncbi:MAG: sulfite exporter TauE/SafE family protein [Provencibacterium sp.]|nr:sulfite exporter TauE/SafE family protein [Provencibacterium sp.]